MSDVELVVVSEGWQGIVLEVTGKVQNEDDITYRTTYCIDFKGTQQIDDLIAQLVEVRNKQFPYPLLKVEVEK